MFARMNPRQVRLLRRLRARRGQSMVAYAVITAVLLGGLTVMSMWVLPELLAGLNSYSKSVYFTINMPLV